MLRVGVVAVAVASLAACAVVIEDGLPGAPCSNDDDCGRGLVCDGDDEICVPRVGGGDEGEGEGEGEGETPDCAGKSDGDDCEDADLCTVDDTCFAGLCVGAPKCAADQACIAGECFDDGSCTLDGTVHQATFAPGNSLATRLAYDAEADELGVVYTDERTGNPEIFFQRLAVDGTPLGNELQLTNGQPENPKDLASASLFPDIAALSGVGFGVTYHSQSGLVFNENIHFRVIADGVPGAEEDVTVGFPPPIRPQVPAVVATNADFAVVWMDDREVENETTLFEIFFARLNAAGQLTTDNRRVSENGIVFGKPALLFNPRTAGFVIAFADEASSLFVMTTDIDGGNRSPAREVPVSNSPDGVALALRNGGAALVWREVEADQPFGSVMFAPLTDEGIPGTPHLVSNDLAGRPSIVAVAGGLALAHARDPGNGIAEVVLRTLDDDGNVTGGPTVIGTGAVAAVAAVPFGVAVSFHEGAAEATDVFVAGVCVSP